jgi:phosphinothricin acetyltransferase
MSHFEIRTAVADDLPALVEIFNFYVTNGHVTFATVPHSVESRLPWFENYADGPHQLLVSIEGGRVLGCSYSSRYRPGPAFDTTVETSIYLHPDARGRGAGSLLYSALLERLASQPIHLAVAGVALPNPGSIALHRRMGFEEVGTFREYAFKHGQWISSTWFQRRVGTLDVPPPDR